MVNPVRWLYHRFLRFPAAMRFRNLVAWRMARARSVTTISDMNIEFVTYCNLRCQWCSLDHARPRETMSGPLFEKLLRTLLEDRRFRSVRLLNLFNGGEALLHPDLKGLLELMAEYKNEFAKRGRIFPATSLLTNAVALNDDTASLIIESGAVDLMGFSIDGGSKELFEEMRRGAKWEKVVGNVSRFLQLNQARVKTRIITIIPNHLPKSLEGMSLEFKELCAKVDSLELRYPHDWMGDIRVEGLKRNFKDTCHFIIHTLVLFPNGNVNICCADINGRKGVIGNLNNQELYDIYNSRKRNSMIRDLLKGNRSKMDLCRNCVGY